MESGLEDRNNWRATYGFTGRQFVSMESGLEDRNNDSVEVFNGRVYIVSMESGLEDRNNTNMSTIRTRVKTGLNGVRPRRPEQWRPPWVFLRE